MNILSLTGVEKGVNDVVLFREVTFGIDAGEKIGVVGRNGSGKSTLLRIISGELEPDGGTVARRSGLQIATVSQRPQFRPEMTLDHFLFDSGSPLVQLVAEYEHAVAETAAGNLDETRLADLTHRMEESGGFTVEARFQSLCRELGIADTAARMAELSGGMVRKASLARAMISGADLLLLDEPTNHLDIDTIEWLEQNLTDSNALLLVTHDRYFLDEVCDSIIEIDGSSIYKYEGNYSRFLERKAEREAAAERAEARRVTILRRELEWLERGPKARTGKDKGRKARAEQLMEDKPAAESTMTGFSSAHRRLGGRVLELDSVSKRYGDAAVIDRFSYEFRGGERIGIIGPNGTGKSTLLELIAGRVSPDSGSVSAGETVTFGYLEQTARRLDPAVTVLDFIRAHAERVRMADGSSLSAEQFLERFLFPRATHSTTLSRVSGGELRRLSLIRLLAGAPNFLLLDEPTNDLDLDTIRLLEDYLSDFAGCMLLVSHDRALLDRLTDHLFVFEGAGRVLKFTGSYADYRRSGRSGAGGDSARPARGGRAVAGVTRTPRSPAAQADGAPRSRKLPAAEALPAGPRLKGRGSPSGSSGSTS